MELDLKNTVKLLCGVFLNPTRKKESLLCACKQRPTDEHWLSCPMLLLQLS